MASQIVERLRHDLPEALKAKDFPSEPMVRWLDHVHAHLNHAAASYGSRRTPSTGAAALARRHSLKHPQSAGAGPHHPLPGLTANG